MKREFVAAKIADLDDGQLKTISADGRKILLVREGETVYALGAWCTHQGAPLGEGLLNEHRIVCPWHQACFQCSSGDVEEPPAIDALPRFEVTVQGTDVKLRVSDESMYRRVPPMSRHNPDADERNFVIVGAGAAGHAAAEALRVNGFEGRVTVVTREHHIPYDRSVLSKTYLKSKRMNPQALYLRSEGFYAQHDIDILLGREVVGLDPDRKVLVFEDDSEEGYDVLLLATGANPIRLNMPGIDLRNVFLLRTLEDARGIGESADNGACAVVVGASFIGMEVAASLTERGLQTTVVAPEKIPFERILGEDIGDAIKRIHEENGVAFRLGRTVEQFEGHGRVQRAVLDNGDTLEADVAVVGIGVRPATGFMDAISPDPGKGIQVDRFLRVGKDIYAAGDIAAFPDWRTGGRFRIEHWRLAQRHGQVAARNMMGEENEFKHVPFFWTDQFGRRLQYVGHAREWDDIIYEGKPTEGEFIAFFSKDQQVLAACGCGRDFELAVISELMRLNRMPTSDALREGSTHLTEVLNAGQSD